ncbi:hypothetical protein BBJ28_00008869 [Nothophytophthora sp. Chile5]|nr:hypothetical protein BBJ28_00008869 [Nothophytophthora sp. Chile5]
MAAMGTLAGADATAPYTLAYFSSDWLQSVDALVLPRLRALLINIPSPPTPADLPTALDVDDPALVQMREVASELFESGQFYAAATRFVEVLLRCPTCTRSSFNLAVILQTLGETYFAVPWMLRVVALDDSDSVAHTVLRYEMFIPLAMETTAHSFIHVDFIYRSVYYLQEPEQVVAGYRSIIAANSESHVRAVHSLATLEGATTTMTAAPEYVAEVFDELAESFEEKLVAHLEYRVPWQLIEALQKLAPPGFIPTDSTSAAEWVVFALTAQKLRAATGLLAFSIELLPPTANSASSSSSPSTATVLDTEEDAKETAASFRLAPSGRFQHSHAYIASLAERSGFSIVVQQDIAVRKESGEPIAGRIYLLQQKTTIAEDSH